MVAAPINGVEPVTGANNSQARLGVPRGIRTPVTAVKGQRNLPSHGKSTAFLRVGRVFVGSALPGRYRFRPPFHPRRDSASRLPFGVAQLCAFAWGWVSFGRG